MFDARPDDMVVLLVRNAPVEPLITCVVVVVVVVGNVIVGPEVERMPAPITPSIDQIDLISDNERFGLTATGGMIIDIISISPGRYAKSPYTIHSIRLMSANRLK